MNTRHEYHLATEWTGNNGAGTTGYKNYERSHTIHVAGKAVIDGSSDPAFRGDGSKHNPEEMLLAAVSACHMLWYLHLCAISCIVVIAYIDHASGTVTETADGGGKFTEIVLSPVVTIQDISLAEKANALHEQANKLCFIANSLNIPVQHKPMCITPGSDNFLS